MVALVVRLAVSAGRDEYSIWPDEPAQLAIARYVGGGGRWYMHNHSIWRPMFATLLAPVYWFTDDPTTVFHAALALNAVLGGIAAALLVMLTARLTSLGPWRCAAVALIVSLSPAVLFTADFVYSESLLLVLYVLAVLVFLRFHERPDLLSGVAAGLVAGLAFGTHSRMLPLTLVLIGLALLAGWRRRLAWPAVALVVAVAGIAVAVMEAYTRLLVDRLWNEPSTRNSPAGVLGQLDQIPALAISLVGQTWSLLVASIGIVGFGAHALVRSALGRTDATAAAAGDRTADAGGSVGDARVVLAVCASCIGLSVVFMADRWRSDQLVYGRYNAVAVLPVLVVGIASLLAARSARRTIAVASATAAVAVGCAAVLWSSRRQLLESDNGLEPMILGLQPFITSRSRIDVPTVTLWSVIIGLVVAATAAAVRDVRHRHAVVLAMLASIVVVGSARTAQRIDATWNPRRSTVAVEALRDDVLRDGISVDYVLAPGSNATVPMMLYQFHLPATPFAVVDDPLDGAPGTLVFAASDDPRLEASGARIVWSDPHRPIALWRR